MLLERMGETVTLEKADGTTVDVDHVLCHEANVSDQSVMDVQTRSINQARYKGDSVTLTVMWPKSASHDLDGGHLIVRGERYRIYGTPFPVAHSPNGYDCRITCTRPMFRYTATLLVPTYTSDEWGVWTATFTETEVNVNLLRLSESESESRDAQAAEERNATCLIELSPETWDGTPTHFRYNGRLYRITSKEEAGETVVLGGTQEQDEDDGE